MGQLLSSKIIIVEEEPRIRAILALPTAVVGAVGITERGPVDQAVLVTSFEEYIQVFGGFTADSDLALAVMGFFLNGGSYLWVVRTVHHTDVSDPATKTSGKATAKLATSGAATSGKVTSSLSEDFKLEAGDTLVIAVDGGADQTATFDATATGVVSAAAFPTGFVGGETLDLIVNGELQSVVFTAADQTVEETAARINVEVSGAKAFVDAGQVVIETDRKGNGIQLQVTGGSANAVLNFPTALQTGTGNVDDISAVAAAEVESVVEAQVSGVAVTALSDGRVTISSATVGLSSSVQVQASSTADIKIGFDNALHSGTAAGPGDTARIEGRYDGTYGNRLQMEVRDATSVNPDEFNLRVTEDGVIKETFPNLSMDPALASYAEAVINDPKTGSNLISFTDLLAGAPPTNRPDNQVVTLAGGSDGLVGLDDNDFIGSAAGPTAMRCLDTVQNLTLLIVPGRATAAVHNAMVAYCEVVRDMACFAVFDPPEGMDAQGIVDYVETTASLLNFSEFAAIYWPRIRTVNPSKSVFGQAEDIVVPPSGHICGVFARTDGSQPGGVYVPPAGMEAGKIFGCIGFETDEVLDEAKRDLVYPKRINPLTVQPGAPRYIDGSRTLKGDGNFPYVAERRGVIFIEQSLKQGLQFARHKNNTEKLRATVRRTIYTFLLTQMNNGAFRSNDPAKAFFVDASDALNPPSVIFAGKLITRVGLATNKPAEFIILRFSQDTRALDEELAAAGA
jgi:phage tail sheath protein FI